MHKIARRTVFPVFALSAILAGMIAVAPAASAEDRFEESYGITLEMSECGVMAVGVTGTCIISLQTWLNIFERAGLVVDGNFGPATEAAVRNFQRNHGLVPDGRFGDASRNALRGEYQHLTDNSVPTPRLDDMDIKCNTATGVNCDIGGAVPGMNGGWVQTVACAGVGAGVGAVTGPLGALGAGIFCDVVLQ